MRSSLIGIAALASSVHATPLLALVQQLAIKAASRQAMSGAAIFGAGDVLAASMQSRGFTSKSPLAPPEDREPAEGSASKLDLTRHAHAMTIGYVYGGAVLPWVYNLAESLFPGRSPLKCALKVLVSCGILSTAGNYGNLLCRRLLSGVELPEALQQINSEIGQVISHDLRLWPAYDLLCFRVIPPAMRPTATAVMSTCWATYLSFLAAETH